MSWASAIALLVLPAAALSAEKTISDKNICNAVEESLYMDKAVPFDPIDVTCEKGIVTLTGTTNNILAKRRAERLAETVKGARTVINRINVEPSADRSASEVRDDVVEALLSDPATDSYQVSAKVNDSGHVTLTGTVDSWHEQQLTKKVATGVRGVTGVTNKITVDYQSTRPDHEIRPEIKQALKWNTLVDHQLIDVAVADGEVRLSGTVGSAAAKRQATYAAWVAGVEEVDDSNLQVRRWVSDDLERAKDFKTMSPGEIQTAIEEANVQDPRVNSFDVEATVLGSTVTLRGTVDNLKAKRVAAENARNTTGVARVVNRIKVRPEAAIPDETLKTDVRAALLRDPYVDRYEIDVSVVDGTAYLSGTVDSYFEKAQAEDAATRVAGITNVSNALTVTDTNWPIVYDPYVYDWYAYGYGWYDYAPTYVANTDAEIREDIEDQMWWSPFVDSDEVTVTVEDGTATLTGTVDSWSERRSATENALEGGAIAVDNNLVVSAG